MHCSNAPSPHTSTRVDLPLDRARAPGGVKITIDPDRVQTKQEFKVLKRRRVVVPRTARPSSAACSTGGLAALRPTGLVRSATWEASSHFNARAHRRFGHRTLGYGGSLAAPTVPPLHSVPHPTFACSSTTNSESGSFGRYFPTKAGGHQRVSSYHASVP